jgi:cytochrome P450
VIGVLQVISKLLEGLPALQQLFDKLFAISKEAHADKRKRNKDEYIDDLIADALADRDDDGMRDDEVK